jgi:hypothetical protein
MRSACACACVYCTVVSYCIITTIYYYLVHTSSKQNAYRKTTDLKSACVCCSIIMYHCLNRMSVARNESIRVDLLDTRTATTLY